MKSSFNHPHKKNLATLSLYSELCQFSQRTWYTIAINPESWEILAYSLVFDIFCHFDGSSFSHFFGGTTKVFFFR